MQVFENFISYRRRESMLEVKNIYDALQTKGFSTFCDVYSLGSGEFNQDLEDWLYCEIKEALEKKKNIICVFTDDVQFPAELPQDIDNIRFQNGLKFDVFYFDKFIDHLISNFMVSEESRSESDAEKDFIIIQDVLVKYVGNARIVSIPNGVHVIGRNAFKNQTKITKLIIPEGVVEIQESAFERCILIPYITFPKSLQVIGDKAFCRCYNLAYVAFDDELKEIGSEAFGFCGKLKTVSLNRDLERIASTAFNNCSQLMEFVVAEDNSFYSVHDGILYDYDQVVAVRCPENYNHDVVELPRTVKSIGEWCFSRCMKLIDIVLPRKLENVYSHVFHDSCNIASLTLGDSIKEFDISALDGWNDRQRIIMGRKFHPVIKYSIEQRMKELAPVERKVIGYQFCLVKTAFEAEEEAVKMAKMLLDNSLIVSGQIKRMRSLYMWEDELCNENEVELTCFTESRLYPEVEEFINSHHSYELCQLICLPIINISDGFGKWISDYTGKIKFED